MLKPYILIHNIYVNKTKNYVIVHTYIMFMKLNK